MTCEVSKIIVDLLVLGLTWNITQSLASRNTYVHPFQSGNYSNQSHDQSRLGMGRRPYHYCAAIMQPCVCGHQGFTKTSARPIEGWSEISKRRNKGAKCLTVTAKHGTVLSFPTCPANCTINPSPKQAGRESTRTATQKRSCDGDRADVIKYEALIIPTEGIVLRIRSCHNPGCRKCC